MLQWAKKKELWVSAFAFAFAFNLALELAFGLALVCG